MFIHSVPFEGSVSLVNLLTSTRLVHKGFDVSRSSCGPACYWRPGTAATRPSSTSLPGNLAGNRQIETLLKEGATVYACRFAIEHAVRLPRGGPGPNSVKAFSPLDVLDSALTAWRGAFQLDTVDSLNAVFIPRGRGR